MMDRRNKVIANESIVSSAVEEMVIQKKYEQREKPQVEKWKNRSSV